MKAITYTKYGSPKVLNLSEINKPIVTDNHILIKMMATAVNSADVRLRKADPFLVRLAFGLFKPKIFVLGSVFCGIVESTGKNVKTFKVGDEVFGLNDKTLGSYSQYLVVSESTPIALKPKNMNFEEAAAVVFGGHTALHFLKKANIKKGQKVLIYGASGSVGSSAVQIAKYYEAEVTAVCSKTNLEMVKKLGADIVIDYTNNAEIEKLMNMEGIFDIVFETVDKSNINEMAKLVNINGALVLGAVLIKGMIEGAVVSRKLKLQLIAGVANVTSKDMEFIKKLCENESLSPVIDKTFLLEDMVKAHEYVEIGHKKGNVVIKIT